MANPNWKKGISGNPNGRPKGSGFSPFVSSRILEVIELAEDTKGCGLADFMKRNNDDFWKIVLNKGLVSFTEVDVTSGGQAIRSWTIAPVIELPAETVEVLEESVIRLENLELPELPEKMENEKDEITTREYKGEADCAEAGEGGC